MRLPSTRPGQAKQEQGRQRAARHVRACDLDARTAALGAAADVRGDLLDVAVTVTRWPAIGADVAIAIAIAIAPHAVVAEAMVAGVDGAALLSIRAAPDENTLILADGRGAAGWIRCTATAVAVAIDIPEAATAPLGGGIGDAGRCA